ncbi:MAG: O-methyltransferase [Clostridiales bacterium]|jgi:predicted O-methyltransferase YrrM|nr:O-methyltransferase [Clostridiales bacterium]
MRTIDDRLAEYLDGLVPPVSGRLGDFQQSAYEEGLPIISRDVANFLSTMLVAKRPCNILEIGCAVGFSAALFAEFLPAGGKITTIDRYEYMINRAKQNFAELGIADKVSIIEECASVALPRLADSGAKFDFIFMDCGKGQYLRFLPYCLEMLASGGLLAADDVLQNGDIALEWAEITRRQRTTYKNMRDFLAAAMTLDGCFSSILPIGDGLLIVAKE